MKKPAALLSAVSALALSSAFAGEIQGTVLTADGAVPLRGAEVTVLGTGRKVATARDGSFRITGLDAGTYELSVNYVGIRSEGFTVTLESPEEVTTTTITVMGDSITVIGQRASLDNALAQQRSADGIVTVLSADAIGQLPDENVAEAARRALGVSIANDQGEGRFISIRGINSQLNATSVNGVRLTSPEAGDRRIGLDVIDADILKNIVINKTLSADMDADAIGGSIELETVSGLDREDRLVKFKLGGIYNEFSEQLTPELAATYLDNFMDGRLGVALSASYQSREFASDNREVDGGWDFESGVPYISEEFEFRNYDIERERLSLAANVDYMLDDDTRLYLNTLYNEFSDQEFRDRVEFKVEDADLTIDGDRALYSAGVNGSEIEIDRDSKDRLEVQQIFSIVTGFERQKGLWTYDGSLAYTHAEEEEPNRLDVNFDYTFEDPGATLGFNVSNPLNPRPVFANTETLNGYLAAENFEFDALEATNGLTEDDEFAFTLNAQRDMEFGQYPGFLKAGTKVRLRDKSYDLDFKEFGLDGDATLAQFETTLDFPIGLFGPAADQGLLRDFAQGNQSMFELEGAASAGESAVSSFDAQEDIFAGYVMGQVDIDKLRITGGVRVEHTEVEATANTFNEDVADEIQDNGGSDFSAAVTPFTFSDSYTDVLPSIQARYNVTEDVIIRASYYASIVRPNFGQFVPAGETNDDGELAAGNPNLERTKANNYDLLVEYYPSPSSIIQGGIFYKTLDDVIVGTETTLPGVFNNVPFEELETFRNIDDGEIFGVEIGYQQALEFLPYGLDGVLVGANYTYTDSEATLDDGSTITLPGQSENIYNAFLGYEKGRLNLRLAYSFKDENVDDLDVDGGAGEGRIVLEQEFLDFSAKFELNENARLYFDAKNLLDTPLEVADRVDGRLLLNQFEEYGLTLQGGILLTF